MYITSTKISGPTEALLSGAKDVEGEERRRNNPGSQIVSQVAVTKEGYKEIEEQLAAVFKYKVTATSGKKNWIENQCRTIEERMAQGDRKKTLTKTDQQKTSVIEDSNENRKNAAVLSRWRECCNDLYNFQWGQTPMSSKANILQPESHDLPVLREEVERGACRECSQKWGKSPGIAIF